MGIYMATEHGASTLFVSVNSMMYVITSILSRNFVSMDESVLVFLGQSNRFVLNGAYWQFITSMFVHADIVHFAGNMFFLLYFGRVADATFNNKEFSLIYLASGLLGNFLSLLLGPFAVSVGASGAIFGVLGAVLVYSGGLSANSMGLALAYSAFFFFFNVGAGVNLYAHFGGLVFGFLAGYSIARRRASML